MKMQNESTLYHLTDEYPTNVVVAVSNPVEMKSTLLNYTVYTLKGSDKKGNMLSRCR
jgi:hypothetical protein